jgi:hypothetical protein
MSNIFIETCKQCGLPEPIPEFLFAKDIKRRWRIDYYFELGEKKIALEVEGGIWTGGRHSRGKGMKADMEKYNEMAIRGITLIRTTPSDLLSHTTINNLKRALK